MTQIVRGPLGYAQTAVTTVLAGTALGIVSGAERVLITAESGSARWRDDGTNPTASVGFPLAAGGVLDYDGNPLALRIVAQSGTVTLSVASYTNRGGFSA